MNTYEILRTQLRAEDPVLTKLIMINAITNYLLKPTKDNFIGILKPLGSMAKYYHVEINAKSCIPLKVPKSNQDILFMIPELIINNYSYKAGIIPLLINLLSHYKNK